MIPQSRARFCFTTLAVFFALSLPVSAAVVAPEAGTATLSDSWQMTPAAGIVMLVLLFTRSSP